MKITQLLKLSIAVIAVLSVGSLFLSAIDNTNHNFGQALYYIYNASTIIVALVAIASLSLLLKKLKPLNDITQLMQQLREGNFYQIDRSVPVGDDEFGQLAGGIYAVLDTIQDIDTDLTRVIKDYVNLGDVEARMNPKDHQGEWRILVEDMNSLIDCFVSEMMEVITTLGLLADGEQDLQIPQHTGKKVVLTQRLTALDSFLDSYVNELTTVTNNAINGNFEGRIDTQNAKGAWQVMAQTVNTFIDAVEKPLDDVMDMMTHMHGGDFDYRLNNQYEGRFHQLTSSMTDTSVEIASYIKEIRTILEAMQAGNMTIAIRRNYVGLFGDIKTAINAMAQHLNGTFKDIGMASANVVDGAHMLSGNAVDLANEAVSKQENVRAIADGIELIDQQSQQNTASAQRSVDIALKSKENAHVVNQDMSKLLNSMNDITKSSQDISHIIKTIEDIAFQTNLLSLNASVEAARAGEHGKGFSVVAEEVRMLAGKSAIAASQTSDLIQKSLDSVNEGMSRAEDTAKSLESIVHSIDELSAVAVEIKAHSTDQTLAVVKLSKSISQINDAISGVAATSETIASASEELNVTAELLDTKLQYFKTK